MTTESIFESFSLEKVRDKVNNTIGGESYKLLPPADALRKWLTLLPKEITEKIDVALNQAMPFMPPDFTPELLSSANETVPSVTHTDIICMCLHLSMESKDYTKAAALIYTLDRALYRFRRSKPLLSLVSELRRVSPETALAPQVTLRSARVLKDEGDLNGALTVIKTIINREDGWQYKDEKQYLDTKAACLHVKGQIYHNLELWQYAIPPLVEGAEIFQKVQDRKGVSTCLFVLSRCLCRLQQHQYDALRREHPKMFTTEHPCFEGYLQGKGAVAHVEHIEDRFFVAKTQLAADESLLMFAVAVPTPCPYQHNERLLHILEEIRHSLAGHWAVHNLRNVESFIEFVRGIFLASLVMSRSCYDVDKKHALLLEDLSLRLYSIMRKRAQSANMEQTKESVELMNKALSLLYVPPIDTSPENDTLIATVTSENTTAEAGHPPSSSDGREMVAASSDRREEDAPAYPVLANQRHCENLEKDHLDQADIIQSESSHPGKSNHSTDSMRSQPANVCKESRGTYPSCDSHFERARTAPSVWGLSPNLDKYDDTSAKLPSKASTMPSYSGSRGVMKHKPMPRLDKHRRYVGLAMSQDELRAATWPLMSAKALQSLEAENKFPKSEEQNLEALTLPTNLGTSAEGVGMLRDERTDGRNTEKHLSLVHNSSTPDSAPAYTSHRVKASIPHQSQSGTPSLPTVEETGLQPDDSMHECPECYKPATVDPNASTKSSSPATPELSTSLSSSCQQRTDELQQLESVSLVYNLHRGLGSQEREDAEQLLASLQPPNEREVQRATLFTFSYDTREWSRQTTLAHIGDALPTSDKTPRGSFRDAFLVNFLHQGEPLGRYVGKKYRDKRTPSFYFIDVQHQMIASYYVTRFNDKLSSYQTDFPRIQFLPAFHLQLHNADSEVDGWLNVEPYMEGHYHKLTNNARHVAVSDHEQLVRGLAMATAFSHYSYVESDGLFMVVDLQGCMPEDKDGAIYLTDPVLHTRRGCGGSKGAHGCDT